MLNIKAMKPRPNPTINYDAGNCVYKSIICGFAPCHLVQINSMDLRRERNIVNYLQHFNNKYRVA